MIHQETYIEASRDDATSHLSTLTVNTAGVLVHEKQSGPDSSVELNELLKRTTAPYAAKSFDDDFDDDDFDEEDDEDFDFDDDFDEEEFAPKSKPGTGAKKKKKVEEDEEFEFDDDFDKFDDFDDEDDDDDDF